MTNEVILHIYDLSQGVAKQLSTALLGKEFKAVYHTGVVVYGIEYFYGGGISTGYPGMTEYGVPIEKRSLGKTEKSLQEVSAYIQSLDKEFSMSAYNPLTHNCNHFSDNFSKFLLNQGIPAEILEQPADFLETPIGKMVGGLFGFSQQPLEYKKETVEKEYDQLYIELPKVFSITLAESQPVINAISGDDLELKNELNKLFIATQDKKDFLMTDDLVKKLEGKTADQNLFEILSLIAMTNGVDKLTKKLQPFTFIQDHMQTTNEGYLRYVNNWFAEVPGMRDARIHAVEWCAFLRRHMKSEEVNICQFACRAYYFGFARTQTYNNIKQTSPIRFLIEMYVEYIKNRATGVKAWAACANMVCGCIGRYMLTIKPRDATAYTQSQLQVRNEVKFDAMNDVKAPCVQQLQLLVGKPEVKKEEDEMY